MRVDFDRVRRTELNKQKLVRRKDAVSFAFVLDHERKKQQSKGSELNGKSKTVKV